MDQTFDTDRVAAVYIKIRDKRGELKKAFEEEDKKLKEKLTRLEVTMLQFLDAHKLKSAPTTSGVFYKQEELTPTGADWEAFYAWVRENNAFDFLERRIKKTEIKAYMEEHDGAIPPGVSVFREFVVRVRRA